MAKKNPAAGARLGINPIACDGIGICAHLAPDLIHVDTWGFPLLVVKELTAAQRRPAARAVAGCPRKALFLAATAAERVG